jgi:UPF0716 family protein affecting phage T7 exclusion
MSRRSRILSFGSAGVLTLVGALCAVFVPGLIGQLLAFVLISLGLGGAVLLVFLEVGLSEDRERAREHERERDQERRERARKSTGPHPRSRLRPSRRPRRLRE